MMSELVISPKFTIEDIHKIREHNHEMTKDLSFENRRAYYEKGAEECLAIIERFRKEKQHVTS
jgi:hypothetical protein